jgi:4,5-dihydroxyphthalate decarboxylase
MNEVPLTLAISDYDHVRDLTTGRVRAEGIALTCLDLTIPEIFARFTAHREWDVSEIGLGKYVAVRSQDDDAMVAIPVFPSRIFRQSALYVRADSPLDDAAQLGGARVGLPEWAQTAAIYCRGWLAHDCGVDLASIEWHQAGVDEAGRSEKVALRLPQGVRVVARTETSLDALLLSGGVDAIMTAQPPASFVARDPRVRRLLRDPQAVEQRYWEATGIFPIMHTVAIRRETLAAHPWIATNLLTAFEAAKARSLKRAVDPAAPRFPIPWITTYAEDARTRHGADYWPYGVGPNRRTLEAFLQFAFEQGVAHRLLEPEDLFASTTLTPVRV